MNNLPSRKIPKSGEPVVTPIWAHEAENRHAAAGATTPRELPKVTIKENVLTGFQMKIISPVPFVRGKSPTLPLRESANHSFAAAIAYAAGASVAQKVDQLFGDGTWEHALGSESLVVYVNDLLDGGAYYNIETGAVHLGVGRDYCTGEDTWHVATDMDVVRHEIAHHLFAQLAPDVAKGLGNHVGDAGAIAEAFGDLVAALIARDPELGEDRVTHTSTSVCPSTRPPAPTVDGHGYRSVHNDDMRRGAEQEAHELGRVYAGLGWSIAEYLHKVFTGKNRTPQRDVEKLDAAAADETLKIIIGQTLFLGTRKPRPGDFVRAFLHSIESLAAAGKLDPRIDVAQLKNVVSTETQRRRLPSAGVGAPVDVRATSPNEALLQATKLAGIPGTLEFKRAHSPHYGPNHERIERFNVVVKGWFSTSVLAADYATVICQKDGTYRVQLGEIRRSSTKALASPTKGH